MDLEWISTGTIGSVVEVSAILCLRLAADARPASEHQQVPAIQRSRAPKPGPRPKTPDHKRLAKIVEPYGTAWKEHKNLAKICKEADRVKVFVPKEWSPVRSWKGGFKKHPDKLLKVIASRLKSIGGLPATKA